MCLIAFAREAHPHYPLVLVANRDEFHDRPTRPMHWWPEGDVLAGQDCRSGGTWLAVSPGGRVTALTNYRDPQAPPGSRSRGELPLSLLKSRDPWQALLALRETQSDYGPFNLLLLESGQAIGFASEGADSPRRLSTGIHGISNGLPDSDWPKVCAARQALEKALAKTRGVEPDETHGLHERLIRAFRNETRPGDGQLPETGVGLQMERFLSPMFISNSHYGTRATTVVTLDRQGQCRVTEQNYRPEGVPAERCEFQWTLSGPRGNTD
ncbi:MAG: NRDE family protein [Oleiphilaceae bacterium]|nr:NRDE family protein [Oleiphilaceae bacterium]